MKRSADLSIGLLGAVTAWMLSGSLLGASRTGTPAPAPGPAPEPRLMKVRVADLAAESVTREIVVQGRLKPRRRVEIRAETAGQVIALPVDKGAGVSKGEILAVLRIAVAEETGHFLSPAVLTLDDSGRVGEKAVEQGGRIAFYPISLVRTEADGVWVSGLPQRVRVITQNQGFVIAGESVEPVVDDRSSS